MVLFEEMLIHSDIYKYVLIILLVIFVTLIVCYILMVSNDYCESERSEINKLREPKK